MPCINCVKSQDLDKLILEFLSETMTSIDDISIIKKLIKKVSNQSDPIVQSV